MQCAALAKSTGKRCRRRAVTGYRVCQVHGAGSPYKGRPGGRPILAGRYSSKLPEQLGARYETARTDSELLSLRDEIALLDAQIGGLIQKLETGESAERWGELQEIYAAMMTARAMGRTRDMARALLEIGALIEGGASQGELWAEIGVLFDRRRRLVDTERRRLVDLHQMITVERAIVLMGAVVDAVARHVDDQETINAIAADLRGLSLGRNRVDAGSPGGDLGDPAGI